MLNKDLAYAGRHGEQVQDAEREGTTIRRLHVRLLQHSWLVSGGRELTCPINHRLRMLEADPSKRATVDDLLDDSWLDELEEDDDFILHKHLCGPKCQQD